MSLTDKEKFIIDFMVFTDSGKDNKMSKTQIGKIATNYIKKNYSQFSDGEIGEFLLRIVLHYFETHQKIYGDKK